ncbi:MAG: LPXTG cell wall anchor domain-containing protein [Candidatus Acidiferrales bacterium]
MDTVTVVRVIAGILAAVVLGVIVWRRRKQASE